MGLEFCASGVFTYAINKLRNQANKAMFKLRQFPINNKIKLATKLFRSLIYPVISYGSEVWSIYFLKGLNVNNFAQICDRALPEDIHNKFCKYLLGVHRKATNAAVKAELGSFPILIDMLCGSVKYWLHLQNSDPASLRFKCLLENYELCRNEKNCWIKYVRDLLNNAGFQETWTNVGGSAPHIVVKNLKMYLQNLYKSNWCEEINRNDNSSKKLRTYYTFKNDYEMENYLKTNIPVSKRQNFSKLRVSAHTLEIELGRYTRPKTPLELRKCKICQSDSVEDEKHFILDCKYYEDLRNQLFKELSEYDIHFKELSRTSKFNYIMTMGNGHKSICLSVLDFVNGAFEKRRELIGHH